MISSLQHEEVSRVPDILCWVRSGKSVKSMVIADGLGFKFQRYSQNTGRRRGVFHISIRNYLSFK
jgi:hypothetical protein